MVYLWAILAYTMAGHFERRMLAVKARASTRQFTKRYHFHFALLVGFWFSSFSLASAQEIVRVCNKGDVEVFYASLGTHQQLLSASARIEGLYPISLAP